MKNKPTYVLQNWSVLAFPENPYQAPELWKKKLSGNVYGHPQFKDGEKITTSRIKEFIDDESAVTAHSIYKLGKKDPNYQLYCDNYDSRL